jgi:hypothetical protein
VLVSAQVALMDADVMITVAFCLEVFFFGLGAAIFVAREAAREARPEAGTENGRERAEPAKMRTRPRTPASASVRVADTVPHVTARAVRGVRS